MSVDLIHVGFDNYLALDRVLAVASPGAAPMKSLESRGSMLPLTDATIASDPKGTGTFFGPKRAEK